MDELADINFTQVRKLKPEFAGLLADYSVGPKEITATIVDMALRDYIYIEGDRISRTGKKTGLAAFERKFLGEVFGGETQLNFEELALVSYGRKADMLISIICTGAVEEGIVATGFEKKLADAVKQATTEEFGTTIKKSYKPGFYLNKNLKDIPGVRNVAKQLDTAVKANSAGGTANKPAMIPAWLLKIAFPLLCVTVLIGGVGGGLVQYGWESNQIVISVIGWFMAFTMMLPAFIAFMLCLLSLATYGLEKRIIKIIGGYENILLTNKGMKNRQLALKLKQYLIAYPQADENLANELASYAVALGIGGTWTRRMGGANAKIALLLESPEAAKCQALYNFIDWQKYISEFTSNEVPAGTIRP